LWGLLCLLAASKPARTQELPRDAQQPSADLLLSACEQSLACRSHLSRANQLYEQNNYVAALDEYQAAYILQPYPLILYNIARIYHKENELKEAALYYQRYLSTGHPDRAARALQLLTEIQQSLEAKPPEPERSPAPLVVEPAPSLVPAPPPVRGYAVRRPLYKKWWFWALIGVATAGVATAVGVLAAPKNPDISGLSSMTFTFGK
jgi:tetratricopeptide (TPR) repeat protein